MPKKKTTEQTHMYADGYIYRQLDYYNSFHIAINVVVMAERLPEKEINSLLD